MPENDDMAAIEDKLTDVAAKLDKGPKETSKDPEEPQNRESNDEELSHPNTSTDTIMCVYNLLKGKNGNRGSDYSHRFEYHSMALVRIALMQLLMK